jgi:hypothetical protein
MSPVYAWSTLLYSSAVRIGFIEVRGYRVSRRLTGASKP